MDVVRGVLAGIKRGNVEKVGRIPIFGAFRGHLRTFREIRAPAENPPPNAGIIYARFSVIAMWQACYILRFPPKAFGGKGGKGGQRPETGGSEVGNIHQFLLPLLAGYIELSMRQKVFCCSLFDNIRKFFVSMGYSLVMCSIPIKRSLSNN